MKPLPRRPQSHQVDYRGRLAFAAMLSPDLVVTHAENPEYGIDGEVEAFDPSSGETTGLHFYFQLKSTDVTDVKRSLTVSLKSSTVNYLRSVHLPVLIVLYRGAAETVYARWLHHYDPYYESNSKGRTPANTITFHFNDADELTAERKTRLAAEARAYLDLRERAVPQPLPLYVRSKHPGVTPTQLATAMRLALGDAPHLLDLHVSASPPGTSTITLTPDAMEVWLFDATSLTIHENLYRDRSDTAQLASDACFAVSMALLHANVDALGVRLALHVATRTALIMLPDFILFLTSALKATSRYSDALQLAHSLAIRGETYAAMAQLVLLAVMGNEALLTPGEREQLGRTYAVLLRSSFEESDRTVQASLSYSLGKLHLAVGEHMPALHHLNQARKSDPAYTERAYYWEDLGGCLFLLCRFRAASKMYRTAMQLDLEKTLTRCLLADSLFYSGRLDAADELWSSALDEDAQVDGNAEWRLKRAFIAVLRGELGAEREVPPVSYESYEGTGGLRTPDEHARYIHEVLEEEPLHAHAWFNLGVAYYAVGLKAEALQSFLATALLNRGDAEAWVNSIVLTLEMANDGSVATEAAVSPDQLLRAAFFAAGEELMMALQDHLDANGVPAASQEALLATVEDTIREVRRERPSMVIRFPVQGNTHFEVEVENLIG